mmetsp:Transcript_123496/g.349055  ORF Transcript_123496/g.349055 Transcript_123496/m.349055 type:complete len:385 (-) Transcript_123496:640-1794(-)
MPLMKVSLPKRRIASLTDGSRIEITAQPMELCFRTVTLSPTSSTAWRRGSSERSRRSMRSFASALSPPAATSPSRPLPPESARARSFRSPRSRCSPPFSLSPLALRSGRSRSTAPLPPPFERSAPRPLPFSAFPAPRPRERSARSVGTAAAVASEAPTLCKGACNNASIGDFPPTMVLPLPPVAPNCSRSISSTVRIVPSVGVTSAPKLPPSAATLRSCARMSPSAYMSRPPSLTAVVASGMSHMASAISGFLGRPAPFCSFARLPRFPSSGDAPPAFSQSPCHHWPSPLLSFHSAFSHWPCCQFQSSQLLSAPLLALAFLLLPLFIHSWPSHVDPEPAPSHHSSSLLCPTSPNITPGLGLANKMAGSGGSDAGSTAPATSRAK